jgi:hypothetical protein
VPCRGTERSTVRERLVAFRRSREDPYWIVVDVSCARHTAMRFAEPLSISADGSGLEDPLDSDHQFTCERIRDGKQRGFDKCSDVLEAGEDAIGKFRSPGNSDTGLVEFVRRVRALSIGDEGMSALLEDISPYLPTDPPSSRTSDPMGFAVLYLCQRYLRTLRRKRSRERVRDAVADSCRPLREKPR